MGHALFINIAWVLCNIVSGQTLKSFEMTTGNVTESVVEILAPTSPRNVSITNITETSLTVQALAPIRPNGILKGYRVYLTYNNFTDTRTYKDNPEEPIKTFVLDDLKPDTVYSVAVKAFSGKHEGAISQLAVGRTDINGPSPPILRNVSCELNNSIIVQMDRPEVFTGSVDMYFIDLYESGFPVDQMDIPTDKRYLQTSYTFRNVTPNMHYDVQVYAATRSNRTGNLIFGAKSNFVQVFVNEGCRIPSAPFADLWAGIFAGLICAISILILGGGGYLIWKKYLQPPYYYLDGTQIGPAGLEWNDPPPPRDPEAEQNPENPEQQVHYIGPIAIAQFHEHVAQLHADGDIGFSKEYDAIQNDPTNEGNSSENSQHPDNKPKNRYLNIIAYDHSRVQLLTMPGQKTSCYINANYIDGFMVSRAYIGTQGPLPSTFDCFWRMIWEQRVTIIVMITNLVERGRRKCDMYWPKEGTEKYGPIEVKLVKEDVMATFTVRTMVIRHSRVQVKRPKDISLVEKTVYQYHYTNWPDHGTPDHPLPVISFVRKSSTANPRNSGPIVVHCSAGVGRTGTYIVIEAMLKQIKAREEINIFGFLRHIRSQRNFLVQTEEQYIFIHDALIEAIDSGDTDIPGDLYHKFVRFLQIPGSRAPDGCQWKTLEQQFAQVVKFKPREFNLVSAHKLVNRRKNRCAVVVPMENSRVHLTPRPGEDGSDYINASWFPGFRSLREYVVTQHPLVKEDFWKLIYDHNIQMIVMLSVISGTEYQVFWPQENEEIKTDVYTCSQVEVTKVVPFLTREFVLKSVQDDFQFKTKFVEALNWPHDGVATIKNMYDFPNYILGLQKDDRGPICVVDRFGGTEAAIFCTLLTVKRQLAFDGSADPYMYAKLYHNKRPGIWVSADDYMKLHFAVQTLCTDIDDNIPNIPPDKYSISDGMPIKQRISITNNNAHEQLSEYSRSPDGFPGHVVAVNIEDDGVRPSTSKEGDEHHKLRNSERVPPEAIPLLNLKTRR
ncbi:hypothetical protein ABEB36_010927 [Hypothenemus hampei]|uniref:Protein-tyrosine-phosphatase n=1 Tax=Hypothenemus hampei TaxID=57062 RepID=A0ABD1EDI9_HYPHA